MTQRATSMTCLAVLAMMSMWQAAPDPLESVRTANEQVAELLQEPQSPERDAAITDVSVLGLTPFKRAATGVRTKITRRLIWAQLCTVWEKKRVSVTRMSFSGLSVVTLSRVSPASGSSKMSVQSPGCGLKTHSGKRMW